MLDEFAQDPQTQEQRTLDCLDNSELRIFVSHHRV
jgi:hypothetical protein